MRALHAHSVAVPLSLPTPGTTHRIIKMLAALHRRTKRGWARAAGMPQSTVVHLMNGDRQPRLEHVIMLADAIGFRVTLVIEPVEANHARSVPRSVGNQRKPA